MYSGKYVTQIYNWAGWELKFRFVNCWHLKNSSKNFPLLSAKEDCFF